VNLEQVREAKASMTEQGEGIDGIHKDDGMSIDAIFVVSSLEALQQLKVLVFPLSSLLFYV
jgi:hypothetical protein